MEVTAVVECLRSLSAQHRSADLFQLTSTGLFIMDLGSRHGTFADEQRLRPREWRCVFDGETISFGGPKMIKINGSMIPNPWAFCVRLRSENDPPQPALGTWQSTPERRNACFVSPSQRAASLPAAAATPASSGTGRASFLRASPELSTAGGLGSPFEDLLAVPHVLNPCGHSHCGLCLAEWFKATPEGSRPRCPTCRAECTATPGPSSLAIQHVLARPRAGQTPRSSILSYVGVTSVSVDYTPAGSAARCERCGQVLPEHSLRIGAATLSAHGGAIAGAHRKLYHRDCAPESVWAAAREGGILNLSRVSRADQAALRQRLGGAVGDAPST
ncbi:hypothetical protein QBZ16_001955 [Prototheca wickerhamii]|uniref:RING-type domain-containing protein n=1 Tax=Prototheca wickerhamii TaxID=3111 RepID=A0AAD9MNT9_PROWI|nr:hypothetical protein QBZ16_001955 [Prototheca wickerhamii]